MPAVCPTCGEEALTETARFCIGCGGPLPEPDIGAMLADLAEGVVVRDAGHEPEPAPQALHLPELRPEAAPPPPSAPASAPREDTPQFEPRPVPGRAEERPAPPTPQKQAQPTRPPYFPPVQHDTTPVVPLPLVVAGVIGLLALLLILLLAA